MTTTRFQRKYSLGRRSSHLAIVVLPSEAIAFQAYRLLHHHGISPEHLAIVGAGYSSPERVGLVEPLQIALHKACHFALMASVLAGALCLPFAVVWKWDANWAMAVPLTALMSGACGALIGGIVGLWGEGSKVGIYRHHLKQGRYLLMMEGPEQLVRWGQEVLSHYYAPSMR